MVYESFNNSIQKIEKSWNRSQENENDLEDIPIVKLDFNSINFNKEIITIPILTNELASIGSNTVESILLENFPDWSLNMIEVFVTYSIDDGFVNNLINESFSEANNNGRLKNGDVGIINQDFHYWFNNIDQSNFLLKVFYSINIRAAQKDPQSPGFGSTPVSTFINLSLKIFNHRIYENMNEKKE